MRRRGGFRSDRQRRAVFAKLRRGGKSGFGKLRTKVRFGLKSGTFGVVKNERGIRLVASLKGQGKSMNRPFAASRLGLKSYARVKGGVDVKSRYFGKSRSALRGGMTHSYKRGGGFEKIK